MKNSTTLLYGEPGTGKTTSIGTLAADPRIRSIGILATEANCAAAISLLPAEQTSKIDIQYINPALSNMDQLLERTRLMNKLTWDSLAKYSDPKKKEFDAAVRAIELLGNWPGKGSISDWDPADVLVVDSLSGLNRICMSLIVGSTIVKSLPQWGAAMQFEQDLIRQIIYDTKCIKVIIAHADREPDEVFGGSNITVSALGRKTAPEIMKDCTDVVLCEQKGGKFTWSNISGQAKVKHMYLPHKENMRQDFKPIIDKVFNNAN